MGNPTVTVKVAGIWSPLADGGNSLAGHVWYELNSGIPGMTESFGFAPIVHGQFRDPGMVKVTDRDLYTSPDYSSTIEITLEQYNKLRDFGKNPTAHDFDLYYNATINSCVDFTWKAFEYAGFNPEGTEGRMLPNFNIDAMRKLALMSQVKWDALRASGYSESFLEGLLATPKPKPPKLPPPPPRDPLALDLNGDGVVNTLPMSRGIHFDLDNSGFAERTSWVAPVDGLLVLDRNNNNFIDGGAELFGTETLLSNGKYAAHGFEALAEFDVNEDGAVDANDAVFSSLRVWRDSNSNGIADSGELKNLDELNIKSIGTTYTNTTTRDINNVEHREAGTFTYNNSTQGITNTLWFESDRRITVPVTELQGSAPISDAIKRLPNAIGFGNTYSLHQAMAIDASGELQKKVQRFSVGHYLFSACT